VSPSARGGELGASRGARRQAGQAPLSLSSCPSLLFFTPLTGRVVAGGGVGCEGGGVSLAGLRETQLLLVCVGRRLFWGVTPRDPCRPLSEPRTSVRGGTRRLRGPRARTSPWLRSARLPGTQLSFSPPEAGGGFNVPVRRGARQVFVKPHTKPSSLWKNLANKQRVRKKT